MNTSGWTQLLCFAALVTALTKPLGVYMHRVFESHAPPLPHTLGRVERALLRLCGVQGAAQSWQDYALALGMFSGVGCLLTWGLQCAQGWLPLNPQQLPGVAPLLALNTAVSFVTNTNWQAYSPEGTMSYATQMLALVPQQFASAAAGLGVALALARGLTRQSAPGGPPPSLGNFWVDLLRGITYLLLPLSVAVALLLVACGVIQNFLPYAQVTTLEGAQQTVAMGPVAALESIKMLGTNGGGFFNANSAHPFENPTPLSNLLEMLCIFAVPAGLTYTFGRMARDSRQGWALFAVMGLFFLSGASASTWAEAHGNPALEPLQLAPAGNMEGKETRFGIAASSLFATVTTDASCGAVNSMHDSFTPLGGLVPLVNIKLGEVIFGGVGAGLYGMLVFVLLTVFLAGLMVGRSPEYLGKKVEAREMQMAVIYTLIFPFLILLLSAVAALLPAAARSLGNPGPHGLSEVLYAYASGTGNNGSAFGGLDANTPWWNGTLALAMAVGRFGMILPVLAIAGSMLGKRQVPESPGTFPTRGGLFVALLAAVIVIVGALTFLPALTLGPILEHFAAIAGKVF